jgi:N-methylhydantoinase A
MGLLTANNVYTASRTAYQVLSPDNADAIAAMVAELREKVESQAQLVGDEQSRLSVTMDGHLVGQSWETPFVPVSLPITPDSIGHLIESFHDAYERRNGKRFEVFPVQAVTFRVQLEVVRAPFEYPEVQERGSEPLVPSNVRTLRHLYGTDTAVAEYERLNLRRGDEIEGPAIVSEAASTTFVPAGRTLRVGKLGELVVS